MTAARPWLPDAMARSRGVPARGLGGRRTTPRASRAARARTSSPRSSRSAVGLSRQAPAAALRPRWCLGFCTSRRACSQLRQRGRCSRAVAFGCARWGSTPRRLAERDLDPARAAVAVAWLDPTVFYDSLRIAGVRGLAERPTTAATAGGSPPAFWAAGCSMAPWLLGLALRFSARVRGVASVAGGRRGRARPGRGDRAAARGAGPARPRRARRRRALAGGDPGAGRVGAVPRRRRHRRAQADDGQHRDLGPRLAARTSAGARDHPGRSRAARAHSRTSRVCSTASAPAGTRWSRPWSALRSRCLPSSRWWRSGCSRRC